MPRQTKKERAIERYYKFSGSKDNCAYCGQIGTTIDHTIPVSFIIQKPEIPRYFSLIKVTSCNDCNLNAGSDIQQTFIERKIYIAKKLYKRNRKIFEMPIWSEEELLTMGHSMIDNIREMTALKRILTRRLSNLLSTTLPDGISNELWIPKIDLEEGQWSGPNFRKDIKDVEKDINDSVYELSKFSKY